MDKEREESTQEVVWEVFHPLLQFSDNNSKGKWCEHIF